jgi:ParB family chromosome partitioning protein
MERKTRLARGLDALFSGAESETTSAATAQVQIASIDPNPFQPRKTFDDDELASLRDSIRTHGVLQPLIVRAAGDRFQLIAGERRLRAAQAAGLESVPVTVVDFNDQQVLEAALVENIQRSDLNPIEKAVGFKDYLERFKMTHEQLAQRLGLARPTITNLVALLDLPPEVQDMIRVGRITLGHAKILKGIQDRDQLIALAKEIVARGLSVHGTEAFLKQPLAQENESNGGGTRAVVEKTAHVQSIENELRQKLATKIEIRVKGDDKGQIVLGFETNDDFERLIEVLRR